MDLKERMHGFRLLYSQDLPEIRAKLHRMEYEKNGAELVFLERDDANMTFSISFKTIPSDDTGVFHIIEHSVLCGSEKYPVREPFVELIKSSLQTFLNAMTFPDKTMYPLCSRNRQDFLNLMDVYLDAVLNPLSAKDPHAFRQEGWHYELDSKDDALTYNGVVYNEMKGAYASSDTVLNGEMGRLLFPDTCYGCESGGEPSAIPDLTYENYVSSHARWYHPSNARIFLDGNIDLDAVLEKIDSFISKYDRIAPMADIPMQAAVCPEEKVCMYEIGDEEGTENRAILARGWVFGTYDELEKNLAGSILTDALCGSNEAPLTKALLEKNLCEDVEFSQQDGIQQLYAVLVVRNCDESNRGEIWSIVERTLRNLAENGLDHKRLHAILNHVEFSTREKDFGGFPKGLVYNINCLDTWLYGGDPAQNFASDSIFASLREKIDNGGFERYLREFFIDCPHRATLCMLPSTTLGEEKAARIAERLANEKAAMDDAQLTLVMEQFHTLRERQTQVDTPEQLASLPQLSLGDIEETVQPRVPERKELAGITVLHYPVETNGIYYADLMFDISDIPQEEISRLSFLLTLFTDVATEHYDALEISSEIDANLGRFDVHPSVFKNPSLPGDCRPAVVVSISCLKSKWNEAVRLADEILNRSTFQDAEAVFNLLRQSRIDMEQRFVMSGNRAGVDRVMAGRNPAAAVSEELSGISMLRWLQETEKNYETCREALLSSFAEMTERIFSRNRLSVGITGELDEAFLHAISDVFSCVPMGEKVAYHSHERRNEAFVIPAPIGFAVKAGSADGYQGSAQVASQYLTYDYLWNSVRVQGGAYGTGLSVGNDGRVAFSSYRDPHCARSLSVYDGAGENLRTLAEGDEPLDRYIISTIAKLEPLFTPRTEGRDAISMYCNGITTERRQKTRTAILHASKEDIISEADRLDAACKDANICVIGGRNVIDDCGDVFDSVENLML